MPQTTVRPEIFKNVIRMRSAWVLTMASETTPVQRLHGKYLENLPEVDNVEL